jgi:hypothetical protein
LRSIYRTELKRMHPFAMAFIIFEVVMSWVAATSGREIRHLPRIAVWWSWLLSNKTNKLCCFSQQANYTDQATAACRRS